MTHQTNEKSLYELQEERILAQSDAFISLLTKRGILGDHQIDNEKVRNVCRSTLPMNWKNPLKASTD